MNSTTITIIPTFNRDYTTLDELLKDWFSNKPFFIVGSESIGNGRITYSSARIILDFGIDTIRLMFNKNRYHAIMPTHLLLKLR